MTHPTPANPIDATLAIPGVTTLDACLARHPDTITEAEYDIIIAHSREERTRFQLKAEAKADKMDGVEDLGPLDFSENAEEETEREQNIPA